MVQLNLNFTNACRYTRVVAHLPHVKFRIPRVHFMLHAALACGLYALCIRVHVHALHE